jgi:hypothetical protein
MAPLNRCAGEDVLVLIIMFTITIEILSDLLSANGDGRKAEAHNE